MNDYELREAIRTICTPLPESRRLRDKVLIELEQRGIKDDSKIVAVKKKTQQEEIQGLLNFRDAIIDASERCTEITKSFKSFKRERKRRDRLRFSNRWARLWKIWYCIKETK